MSKISQILLETKKRQIVGTYTAQHYNSLTGQYEEIDGYCAFGVLGCNAGMFDEREKNNHVVSRNITYARILEKYGLTDHIERLSCKFCDYNDEEKINSLSQYIIHLNDQHLLPFARIGVELEKLGY